MKNVIRNSIAIAIIVAIFALTLFVSERSYAQPAPPPPPPSPGEPPPIPGSVPPKAFSNEADVGIVMLSGNSPSDSYNLKEVAIYKWSLNEGKVLGDYLQTRSTDPNTGDSVETAFKWDAGTRYTREQNPTLSYLAGYLLESNVFAGFLRRHNTDAGVKITLMKTPDYSILTEDGYRYIHQDNIDGTKDHSNNARLYVEGNYNLNPTNSAKLWVEYLANLDKSTGWKANTEASISSALNTYFSLKVAYLINTDNAPPDGKKDTDTTFTTALVSKF